MSSGLTVTILGATGSQGGATVRALLRSGYYKVKAVTRDTEKPAAQELKKLGATVVKADMNDKKSIVEAFKGSFGIFSVQNFWELGSREKEVQQGKLVVDAAKEAGVSHIVYSGVEGHERTEYQIQGGVPHFDAKFDVEKYIRAAGFQYFTILKPVFFADNWTSGFKQMVLSGKVFVPALSKHRALQVVATEDIGVFAQKALENPGVYTGRSIGIANDELTVQQQLDIIGKKLGKTIEHVPVDFETAAKQSHEMAIMFKWFEEFGYKANIEEAKSIHPGLQSFEQWVQKNF